MASKAKKMVGSPLEAGPFLEALMGGPLTFGLMLRSIREGEEETQSVFATRLGITKQNLSDIENGRRGVSVERAAEWANALGYHAGQFMQLAIQAQINAAGLPFLVKVESVSDAKRAARKGTKRQVA